MRKLLILAPLALLLLLAGCETPIELNGIHRVAVLTPAAPSGPAGMSALIKQQFLAQLPRFLTLEVIDGAQIEAQLGGVPASLDDTERLAEICGRFGVDGFIITNVTGYREDRDGGLAILDVFDPDESRPGAKIHLSVSVSLTSYLVRAGDRANIFGRTATGTAIHTITLDPRYPIFSLAEALQPHFAELREKAARDAVRTLLREVWRQYS